jgi:hypothetical protein
MLPGFTAFVSTKEIEGRLTYQASSNKHLSNGASSSRVLPLQGTCPVVSDIYVYWNSPPPLQDAGCKWRMRSGENWCKCSRIDWTYKGELTQHDCNRIGSGFVIRGDLKSGAASPINAPCWVGDLHDCSDSTCSGPNPHPRGCPPGQCLLHGQCVYNGQDKACGPNCLDCTVYPGCGGTCVSNGGSHHCFCP